MELSFANIFSSFQSFYDGYRGFLFRGNIQHVARVYRDGTDHVMFVCMLDFLRMVHNFFEME